MRLLRISAFLAGLPVLAQGAEFKLSPATTEEVNQRIYLVEAVVGADQNTEIFSPASCAVLNKNRHERYGNFRRSPTLQKIKNENIRKDEKRNTLPRFKT